MPQALTPLLTFPWGKPRIIIFRTFVIWWIPNGSKCACCEEQDIKVIFFAYIGPLSLLSHLRYDSLRNLLWTFCEQFAEPLQLDDSHQCDRCVYDPCLKWASVSKWSRLRRIVLTFRIKIIRVGKPLALSFKPNFSTSKTFMLMMKNMIHLHSYVTLMYQISIFDLNLNFAITVFSTVTLRPRQH